MTRAEKIKKLANAIKEYRGSHRPTPTKEDSTLVTWIRAPKPDAIVRVRLWFEKLGGEWAGEVAARIDEFKSMTEFYAFLKELE